LVIDPDASRVDQLGMLAEELQLTGPMSGAKLVEKQRTEQG
jgi:hypothetical protein